MTLIIHIEHHTQTRMLHSQAFYSTIKPSTQLPPFASRLPNPSKKKPHLSISNMQGDSNGKDSSKELITGGAWMAGNRRRCSGEEAPAATGLWACWGRSRPNVSYCAFFLNKKKVTTVSNLMIKKKTHQSSTSLAPGSSQVRPAGFRHLRSHGCRPASLEKGGGSWWYFFWNK